MTQILGSVALWVVWVISNLGYLGTFICMAIEGACIPLPSEIILPFSGFLVSTGRFNFWVASFLGAFGNAFGSSIMYYIGKKGGRPFVDKYGKYFLISKSDVNHAQKWFSVWGKKTVFVSQLLPVLRTYISLPSGILKIGYLPFVIYTFMGAFVWSTFLVYLGMILGQNWKSIEIYFKKFDLVITIIIFTGLILVIYKKIMKFREIEAEQKS